MGLLEQARPLFFILRKLITFFLFDFSKVMLSGCWKSVAMLVKYGRKIQAKRSGIADFTTQLGWNTHERAPLVVNRPGHDD